MSLVRVQYGSPFYAEVAELADAHDSKSCSARSVGSTPTFGTIIIILIGVNHFRKSFRLLSDIRSDIVMILERLNEITRNWKKICIATKKET